MILLTWGNLLSNKAITDALYQPDTVSGVPGWGKKIGQIPETVSGDYPMLF